MGGAGGCTFSNINNPMQFSNVGDMEYNPPTSEDELKAMGNDLKP